MSFTEKYQQELQKLAASGQSTEKKKKRKYTSFNIDPTEVLNTVRSSNNDTGTDIAPVSTVGTVGTNRVGSDLNFNLVPLPDDFDAKEYNTNLPTSENGLTYVAMPEKDERKWFQKGAFEDGYQFGDIAKTILGTGEDLGENLLTGIVGMGEKIVDAGAWLGAAISLPNTMQAAQGEMYYNMVTGKDTDYDEITKRYYGYDQEIKQDTTEFIAKDLYDEEKVAKKIVSVSPNHMLNQMIGVDAERDSVMGEKSDALAQSGGQLLATAGLQMVGVPWWLTTGTTSFGGEVENALNQGASFGEAGASAAISAGAEILTEKLSGGIKFGGNTLDDVLLKPLTERIASKGWKFLVNMGIDAVGEGTEEVVSGFFSNLGTALYKEEDLSDILFSEQAMDEYLEGFIGGAVLGGVGGSVQGLKPDIEQDVITREYNDRVDEVESNTGKKTTAKEKSKIYNEVVEDVESGYISVDRIEEILGGETYKTYKSTLDSETATQEEYDKLYNMKNGDKSDADIARQAELKKLLDEGTKSTELKSQLGTEVFELVKNTRLSESYNERTRRGQAYEADLTQYDEAQRQVIQNAIDSGILNNTNRTHRFVDMIAKISADKGVSFDFTDNAKLKESGFAVDGKEVNGFVTKDGITLNINSSKALNSVVGHEITHVLEGTELYTELQSVLFEYAKSKNDFQHRYDAIVKLYKNVKGADFNAELAADLVGDYLFSDKDFVKKLSTEHRNIFQKIYDEIKYLLRVATAGSKEARELEKVKRAFEDAYRESGKNKTTKDGGTTYSLSERITPTYEELTAKKPVHIVDVLEGIETGSYADMKAEVSAKAEREGWFDTPHHNEDTDSLIFLTDKSFSHAYSNLKADFGEDTIRAMAHIPEVIRDAVLLHVADPKNPDKAESKVYTFIGAINGVNGVEPVKMTVKEYDFDSLVRVPENIRAYFEKNGVTDSYNSLYDAHALEVIGIEGIKKEPDASGKGNGKNPSARATSDSTINVADLLKLVNGDARKYIPQPKAKLSVAETDKAHSDAVKNRDWDTAQRLVDEAAEKAGYTRAVYHGTESRFTVFDTDEESTTRPTHAWMADYPDGTIFLAEDYNVADGYGDNVMPLYLDTTDMQVFEEADMYAHRAMDDMYGYEVYNYPVIAVKGKDMTIYATLDNTRVKSSDAATYDDNGNLIPLSERFNHSNPDIRFSLSEAVEETNDLMALHNLKSTELLKSLDLGGLPMPSIAVIKAEAGHDQYGDVSLILPKESIDPKANKDNKVYGGDAWTPTYPRIEYKARDSVEKKISDKYYNLANKVGYDAVRPLYRYVSELESVLNNAGGEAALLDELYSDTNMMQVYLEDSGKGKVEPVVKETRTEATEVEKAVHQRFIDRLGEDAILSYKSPEGTAIGAHRRAFVAEHKDEIAAAWESVCRDVYHLTDEQVQNVLRDTTNGMYSKLIREAGEYLQNGGVTVKTETDYEATKKAIIDKSADGYKAWVDDLFKGVEERTGFRNNLDAFTSSGNRRSWNALHWENTLENVVKAMRSKEQTGADAFAPTAAFLSVAHKQYGSIDEIKSDSDRLGRIPEEEYKALEQTYLTRLTEIARSIADPNESNPYIATDYAADLIVDAVRSYKTKAGMLRYMQKWNKRVTAETVDEIFSLVNDVANMPTGYFEAKPMRAVSFDEVGVFVIPYNADVKLKQELLNRGYAIAEYNPDIEGDRQKVVNSFEQYKFSLSEVGEQSKRYGSFYVPASELAYRPTQDIAPIAEAPVAETGDVMTPVEDMFPDDAAPVYDEEYESERFASLDDVDMPPEAEAPYYQNEPVTVDDPFEERDISEVGNRKVKAYMYENPEVKPFFQAEAKRMLTDLRNTTKGERWTTWGDFGGYGVESYYRFGGTKRDTAADIAELLDNYGYTYAEIEKGLNAIIEDHGAENNAVSKRIEFMLNDRLMYGYKDFLYGYDIPPDQDYIDLVTEKQVNEYSREAFDKFMETADDYAPYISEEMTEAASVENNVTTVEAPVIEKYEAIRPKSETKQPRMARATPAEEARAEILTEEPKVDKKKRSTMSKLKNLVLDKGMVFEDLSLKTGNRELQARWNSIRYAEGKAQKLIGEGDAFTDSLKSIQERVEQSGKLKPFYEYLYHMHNADRMTLAERFEGVENKPVFGDSVTADISREAAAKLLRENPEFGQWARDVYNYNKHLRDMLVEGGVISKETARLWARMYPHYVPIRREGDVGLNVNVPLDTGRTGVNAPIKRATGGSRNILPLFDTMGQRTIQTVKAIAKNRFGVELKNTLGTTIDSEAIGVDEAIDSIDTQDGLLQEGLNGMKPTFTVFENGEKVTFEITDEMYDAMKPTEGVLAGTSKVLNTASNIRRGVLTEYNPWFLLKNAVKDVQDVLINSQHAAKTYASIPSAIKQMATKGHWYQEYLDNGGDQNTYFDNETNTIKKENRTLEIAKKVTGLEAISKANNVIERLPRLAEYIASRKEGRSIDVAMLDAARVTTNFAAGGDATKWLNRNGATFLNASVQGVLQQYRNIREIKVTGVKGAIALATRYMVAGLPVLLLNHLIWDDDEEYEELSDYVKENYYIVGKYGDGKFVRIPKGRMVAVIQNAFEQVSNVITGDDEADWGSFLELAFSNLAPNNPIENNIFSPIAQVWKNKTWYGEDLVPTRLQDLPAAEQYDESTDAISRWLGETFDISPYKVNYLLDQYSGVIGDTFLPMLTPEAEGGNNTFVGNMIAPLKDMFTTDSVMKNQNVSDFYETKDELAVNAKASGATDEDILKYKYLNTVNAELADLYAQKREIQNSDLPDAEKYAAVREVQKQIDAITEDALNTYENVNIEGGNYATIGDVHYRLNDNGEWQKINDEQYKKQGEVTSFLNITPSEYWSDKAEYDYAYDNPEKYKFLSENGVTYDQYKNGNEEFKEAYTWAFNNPEGFVLSQVVADDVVTYRRYASDLYDIHADKDSNGKSINGSRKEKVIDYINNMDADYGEKIILFKSEYPADDTYNYDIIEYLNGRDDISYEEMKTILIELGFTVHSDGRITW